MARRTKAEADQTRRRILDAALDLFAARGYELTTLDDVARRIRLTKGAVYWHFKSKPDLFDELVANLADKHGAQIVRDLPDPQCLSAVPDFFSEWARLISATPANRKFFRMMMSLWWMENKSASIQSRLCQMEKAFFSSIETVLRNLQKKGEIRPEADLVSAARVMGALWLGFTALQLNCRSAAQGPGTIGLGFSAVIRALDGRPFKSEEKQRMTAIQTNHLSYQQRRSCARFPGTAGALLGALWLTGCGRPFQGPTAGVPEVATITVTERPLLLTTELPGRTVPFLIAEIRPQVSGLILKRLFTEGSDVKAGQTLYEIDPAPFQAAKDIAEANLEAARKAADQARAGLSAAQAGVTRQTASVAFTRANRKRFEELIKEKAVSANDCEQAVSVDDVAAATLKASEADVQSAQSAVAAAAAAILQATAALKTAQINLDYTKIVAPISGRIGKSSVTVGAIVTAYQAASLATIQQLDPIYVDVPQSTADQLRLKRRLDDGRMNRHEIDADKVRLLLDDGSTYPLEGTFQFSDVSVDTTTGSVILRMVFPNPDSALLPGMFVRTVIKEGVNEKAILVPQNTVSRDTKGNPTALVVRAQGIVELRMLSLDRAIGNEWLVATGLATGDQVIAEGLQRVRPGAAVKVLPNGEVAQPVSPSK